MITQTAKGSTEQDITKLITTYTWSGDYKQAARQLTLNVANTPTDYYLPKISITTGAMIRLYDNTNELYRGYAFAQERNRTSGAISVTTYDGITYLSRNKATYNFKKTSPQAITRKVCADFGITIGTLATTGTLLTWLFKAKSLYEIIMLSYTKASATTGKKYMPIMKNGKLSVIVKGTTTVTYIAESNTNISEASYNESIDGMVNKVKIYNSKDKYVGFVSNSSDITNYGLMQDIYSEQTGINATAGAKAALIAITRTGKITCVPGDTSCITGNAIRIKEPYTGLTGLFYIDTDTHTFENGQHTMELDVDFQNLMDEVS